MRQCLFLFLLTLCLHLHAHQMERYIKTKDGSTYFSLVTVGSIKERKAQDAFLDLLLRKLQRRDDNIPIYLLTDKFNLFVDRNGWFATIAYDTLRSPDPVFIEDYFFYRMEPSYRNEITRIKNPPSAKYQYDLLEPIDLWSSYDTNKAQIGVKIYNDYDYNGSTTGWDRLFTLVQYSIDHIEEIKKQQKRIVLPYPLPLFERTTYKPDVSILTIDTGLIQRIPLL